MDYFLKKNKNIILVSTILIFYHYLLSFILSNLNSNDLFFLSLGYPSDPVVLPLVLDFNKYFLSDTFHFSNILFYLPEHLIFKIFGFEYIWLTAIIYKLILCFIILKILSHNNEINSDFLFIFSLIIILLSTSNFGANIDRIIRPSFSNIFQSILILILYKCHFKKFISKIEGIILGISSAATLSMAPWNFFFIIPLFLINIKNLNLRTFLNFLFFFTLIYFPNLKSNYDIIMNSNNHLDYLGVKEIYDKKVFIFDFLREALISKKIIFAIFCISIFSILSKNFFYIKILFTSIIFGFAPYILISKTVLSYHILEGFFDFLFISTIFIFFYFCIQNQIVKKNLIQYNFYLKILFTLVILIYPLFNSNSWIVRSDKLKLNYEKHFNNIDAIDEKKVIISNDKYIRFYLYLNSRIYLPEDGFFNISKKNVTYKKLAKIIELDKNTKNDFLLCMYLKSATENLFDSTRSTKSENVIYSNTKKIKKINSTSGWVLTIPSNVKNKIYESINNENKPFYYYDKVYGYINLGAEKNKCKFEKLAD